MEPCYVRPTDVQRFLTYKKSVAGPLESLDYVSGSLVKLIYVYDQRVCTCNKYYMGAGMMGAGMIGAGMGAPMRLSAPWCQGAMAPGWVEAYNLRKELELERKLRKDLLLQAETDRQRVLSMTRYM